MATTEDLENLAGIFIKGFGVDRLEFDSESISAKWRNQVIERKEDLKMFQILMREFIGEYILHHKVNSLDEGEINNVRTFIERESAKIERIKDIRNVRRVSVTNVVDDVIIPVLCYNFIYHKRYWNLVMRCLECKEYFIAKTRRRQFYCRKECKDKNTNRKRVKSEWAGYMREYRKKLKV